MAKRSAVPRRQGGEDAGEVDSRLRLPYLPGMSRRVSDEAALSAMSLEELWRLFPVILSESRPEWAEIYRREKEMLESVVPLSRISRLSHFGSTSVPGLAAKPTIDILLEVRPDSFVFETLPLLEKCGYRDGDMLPLSKERAMELYERDLTVYAVVDGGSAEMLFDREELALLSVDRKRK